MHFRFHRDRVVHQFLIQNQYDVLKMETEIFNIISHIENVSKKRVTDEIIKSELRKKDVFIGEKDFETAVDNLVSSNQLELHGNDTKNLYFIITH